MTATYRSWNEATKWINYTENSFDSDYPSPDMTAGVSVAQWVIESVFDLSLEGGANYGSYLPGYDIKNRDAYQMVQLSLAYELINRRIIECYATPNGNVKFHLIGAASSISTFSDVLYSVTSTEVRPKCDNVLILGYDPPPKRFVPEGDDKEYDMFTFANLIGQNDPDFDDLDAIAGVYPRYHIWGDWLLHEPDSLCNYYQEGYIEYGKPEFDQELGLVTAGVYDPKKFEKVDMYIYKIEVPFFSEGNTIVSFESRTPRFKELSSFGELQLRAWKEDRQYVPTYCSEETEVDASLGIYLEDSENTKFLGVRNIYIYGYKLDRIKIAEYEIGDGYVIIPKSLEASLKTMYCEPFTLSGGEDYIIVKDPSGLGYRVIFSCNVRDKFRSWFGGSVAGPTLRFKVDTACLVGPNGAPWDTVEESYLVDWKTKIEDPENTYFTETIFPMGEGQAGYVVKKIVVVYDWDNPCVKVYDKRNVVTEENLRDVKVSFRPVLTIDRPAPAAINGTALDPSEIIPDLQVDTVENLENTAYARAFSDLEAGDIKLTLPFAEETDCENISDFIKNDIYGVGDSVESTTYICNPDAEPVLGEEIDGKIINSIDYSYQDSSQYLINVQAGPMWQGLSSWDQSIYTMRTERLQLEGIVTEVGEENVKIVVKLEKLGIMECINGTRQILEKGDRVQVTVYNNPISV